MIEMRFKQNILKQIQIQHGHCFVQKMEIQKVEIKIKSKKITNN